LQQKESQLLVLIVHSGIDPYLWKNQLWINSYADTIKSFLFKSKCWNLSKEAESLSLVAAEQI